MMIGGRPEKMDSLPVDHTGFGDKSLFPKRRSMIASKTFAYVKLWRQETGVQQHSLFR
jgi:hypothetical protein